LSPASWQLRETVRHQRQGCQLPDSPLMVSVAIHELAPFGVIVIRFLLLGLGAI